MKRPRNSLLTDQQAKEIYPLLDRALELPFGKAVVWPCTPSRADYLSRMIEGEKHRSAIESIMMYSRDDALYGKGLYYNIVAEPCPKGLVVALVENPPESLIMRIVRCAAFRQPVPYLAKYNTASSRLKKMKERYREILGLVVVDEKIKSFRCVEIDEEELIVVDIDVNADADSVPTPTEEDQIKADAAKNFR